MFEHSDFLTQSPVAPNDPDLPGGDALVDRASLRARIRDWIGESPRFEDSDIRFDAVRYKPGSRLTVTVSIPGRRGSTTRRFTFRAFRSGESAPAFEKLLVRQVPESAACLIRSAETILLAFPYDYELRGLRKFTADKDGATYFRRLLPELALPESRLRTYSLRHTMLRYKPERHAVIRVDFRIHDRATGKKQARSVLARAFPPDAIPSGATSRRGPNTPEVLAVDPARGVVIEAFVSGDSFRDRFLTKRANGHSTLDDVERVGAALGTFHGSVSPPASAFAVAMERRRQRLERAVRFVAERDPDLASPMQSVSKRLVADMDTHMGPLAAAHRDLHPGQILCDEERVWFVDTEKRGWDSVAADLGALLFFMDRLSEGASGDRELDALLRGYERTAGWIPSRAQLLYWKSVAAFERTTAPLRNLHPQWRTWCRAYIDHSNAHTVQLRPVSRRNARLDRDAPPVDRVSGELR